MDSLTIAAASGLRARMESLDMLANNLANASTPGFKVDREFYSLYVSPDALDPFSFNGYPTTLPLIDRPWTDFRPGTIEMTGNPFHLAISGRGFFAVEGPAGPIYTRNGIFRLSPDGVLVTQAGYPVRRAGGGRIQANGGAPLEVRPDGTVYQGGAELGRIEIADFANLADLRKLPAGYFAAPPGVTPSPAAAQLGQGRLESSNASAAEGAVRLVSVLRQFEMLQKAITLGAEMNRKAVEEVARVGG
ncbi:MAG: flagellar hook basal-body protein [Bryobacteraceae bacterium]|nr:flagellar hook basal-body protein [Bryobacteraceae bacterium]